MMLNEIDVLVKEWIINEFGGFIINYANVWYSCLKLDSGFNMCWVYFHNDRVIVRSVLGNCCVEYSRPSFFGDLWLVIAKCL